MQRLPAASGEVFLQCQIRDLNPDYGTVKLEYRGIDHAWHALESVADAPVYSASRTDRFWAAWFGPAPPTKPATRPFARST